MKCYWQGARQKRRQKRRMRVCEEANVTDQQNNTHTHTHTHTHTQPHTQMCVLPTALHFFFQGRNACVYDGGGGGGGGTKIWGTNLCSDANAATTSIGQVQILWPYLVAGANILATFISRALLYIVVRLKVIGCRVCAPFSSSRRACACVWVCVSYFKVVILSDRMLLLCRSLSANELRVYISIYLYRCMFIYLYIYL